MPWPVRQLTLLQVNLDIPSKKEDRKRLTGKSVPDSVELDNVIEKISNHWPANTTPEKLQIIVELSPGKPRMDLVSEISLIVLPPSLPPSIFGHPHVSLLSHNVTKSRLRHTCARYLGPHLPMLCRLYPTLLPILYNRYQA
jgi:hypothetical protein